jgi:hypothetical protein
VYEFGIRGATHDTVTLHHERHERPATADGPDDGAFWFHEIPAYDARFSEPSDESALAIVDGERVEWLHGPRMWREERQE